MSFAQRLQRRKQALGTPGTPQEKHVSQPESPAITRAGHVGHLGHQKNNKQEEKPVNEVQEANTHPGVQQWQTLYGQSAPAPAPAPTTETEEQDKQPPQRQAQRGALVAVLHSTPEWVAARDNWHRHLFSCGVCQQHHARQSRRPFTPSPCTEGRELHTIYEHISQSISEAKN